MTGTVADFVVWGSRTLTAAGVPGDARREVRLLLAHAEGVTPETLFAYPERMVANDATARSMVERRAAREPVSRIIGKRAFWKHEFEIGPGVLDPRPDTETLIDVVLRRRPDRDAVLRLADLGVGSGCILLSLLAEYPTARGVGIDIDAQALDTAARNARSLRLQDRCDLARGSWCDALEGRFQVIVSNPPYIETGALAGLEPEVRDHDPARALDGGDDGLDAYRAIVRAAPGRLTPGGLLAVEIGCDQGPAVRDMLAGAGLAAVEVQPDLAGLDRIVSGVRPEAL